MIALIKELETIEEYKQAQACLLSSFQNDDNMELMFIHQMEAYNKKNNVSVSNGWQLVASVPCKPCALGIQAESEIVLHLNNKGELVTHFHNLQVGGTGGGSYFKDTTEAIADFKKRVLQNN